MTAEQAADIQAHIDAFMEVRGGYVASASEGELFRLLASYGAACAAQERERCHRIISEWQPTGRASDMAALAAAIDADQPGA